MKPFLTITLGSVVWLALASAANGQLTLWYDARPNLSEIDDPVPPYTNSASLCSYAPYGIGQEYPLYNDGGRGDAQIIYSSPKLEDVTDYTGCGPPDGLDEHCYSLSPSCDCDRSQGDFYLYAAFDGNPGEVISSIGLTQIIPAAAFTPADDYYYLQSVTTSVCNSWLWDGASITGCDDNTDLEFVQVPIIPGPSGPVFDPTQGLGPGDCEKIAQIHVETAYRAGQSVVAAYGLRLEVDDHYLCTRVSYPGPAPILWVYFGYLNGTPESGGWGSSPGVTSPTDDMTILVVPNGDFDLDGQAATSLDDLAYYEIAANYTGTNCNPFELYLGDFDCDGIPYTDLDLREYWKLGASPPGGACCLSGSCHQCVHFDACVAAGGYYLGDGTTCEGNPCAPPVIQVPPQSCWKKLGEEASFSVVATGTPPLTYRWMHMERTMEGETEPTLVIPSVTEDDAGTYQVVVTDGHWQTVTTDTTVHLDVCRDFPPTIYPELSAVPEAWLGEVHWNGDVDPVNKIEDAIDNAQPGLHQIVVAFNVHVGPEQIAFLSSLGEVEYVCRFISAVSVDELTYEEVEEIADRDDVALIERQLSFAPNLNVSLQSLRVIGPYYGQNTVEYQFPSIRGGGVNIAIMDTGVDDPGGPGITHRGLPAAVRSYNALDPVNPFVNPDDADGHGTHVAGIALGGGAGAVTRGVAPAASLIDVKVLPATPEERARANDEGWGWVMMGIETLIQNRWAWNVGVINMSLGAEEQIAASDPVRTVNLILDYAVALGITVVVAAGNEDVQGFFPPADADRALTVGASNDWGTPDRGDDQRATFPNWWGSQWGPRAGDGDGDFIDELKPVVVAPGAQIYGALYDSASGGVDEWGTSMAAPHVAGLVALLRQQTPTIQPLSVVQKLTTTAERRGPPSDPRDPYWNNEWGWGLVDAITAVGGTLWTDMTFPNDGIGVPWASLDISVSSSPVVGVPNRVYAQIQNRGPYPAENVRINFGVKRFIAATRSTVLDDLGTVVLASVPVGTYSPSPSVVWTPMLTHECLYVEIGYALDTVQLNNDAQRNVNVTQSPISFAVLNYLVDEPIQINLVPTFEGAGSEWQVEMVPSVTLGPGDTTDVTLLPIPPANAPDGATETIHVAAMYGNILLGGVSIEATKHDCNGNTIDDYFDVLDETSEDCDGNGVPDECQAPPACDTNCDGSVNGQDIQGFIEALLSGIPDPCSPCNSDVNGDDSIDELDIEPFVAGLLHAG